MKNIISVFYVLLIMGVNEVGSQEKYPILFELKAPIETSTIHVAGDFNGWSATANPMIYSEETNQWETSVELEPGDYEYRFLRDERKNIKIKTGNLLFDRGGWQICSKEICMKRLNMKEGDLSADGFCRRGENLLAFMPKKLYQKKVDYKFKKANAPVDAIKRLVSKGDQKVGGDIHKSLKGIQTEEQMGKVNWR